MIEQSLLIIKPNAFVKGKVGAIINILEEKGFQLKQLKLFQFDPPLAKEFYAEHIHKAFYPRLEEFMCSAPSVAVLLEKEDAIEDLRELLGAVEPSERKEGTIRYYYGEGATENGAHASDSKMSAIREIKIIFG